jgi:hypothetical protein
MAGDDSAQHAASRSHRDLCDLKASQVTTVASAKVSFGFIFLAGKRGSVALSIRRAASSLLHGQVFSFIHYSLHQN